MLPAVRTTLLKAQSANWMLLIQPLQMRTHTHAAIVKCTLACCSEPLREINMLCWSRRKNISTEA